MKRFTAGSSVAWAVIENAYGSGQRCQSWRLRAVCYGCVGGRFASMRIEDGEYLITARGGQLKDVVEIKVTSAAEAEGLLRLYTARCGPGGEVQVIGSGGKPVTKTAIADRARRERQGPANAG
jgi:hypothetical protein